MFGNHLKTAWRSLLTNRFLTILNLIGLSTGLTCSLLILLWVRSELAIDAFHVNGKRLYQVFEVERYDNKIDGNYDTPYQLTAELTKVMPEIELACTMQDTNDLNTFSVGRKSVKLEGTFASCDLFKMFSYPLVEGNVQNALNSPRSIAISHNMAKIFFGSKQSALGKTIRFNDKNAFIVTAVFADLAENVSRKFDYVINWEYVLSRFSGPIHWANSGPHTYILLRKNATVDQVSSKIKHFLDNYYKEPAGYHMDYGIQPFDEVYLHSTFRNGAVSGGRIDYVRLFGLVAFFILVIACINFMNLTTAQSVKRAKEIGVRKVMGAERGVLVKQFIGEAFLSTCFAVAIALVITVILLPIFNTITQKHLLIPVNHVEFWFWLFGLTLITGGLAGSYPAFYLSAFNPVKVLKGNNVTRLSGIWVRKGLVVFQFVLSIILITATVVVSTQVNFIQNQNLGFNRTHLLDLPIEGKLGAKYSVLKNEALQLPGVTSVTSTNTAPTFINNFTNNVSWAGKEAGNVVSFAQIEVGYDFLNTLQLRLLEGRDLSKANPTDSSAYIINETAREKLGYTHPLGRPITFNGMTGNIIGLVRDFHFRSMHEKIPPLIIRFARWKIDGFELLVRIKPGDPKETLAGLKQIFRQLNPDFPFSYSFVDDQFQKLYTSEYLVGRLSKIFTLIAILISCLGLIGLSTFTAEQRVKEIGIRKVLGASITSLFSLLSLEFLILVGLALVIAIPGGWLAIDTWLKGFAYHIEIEWWMFIFPTILIIVITLATVSFQAARVALLNPIKSLRVE